MPLAYVTANHEKSVFYQLDLADAAREFVGGNLDLPDVLPTETPLMKQIHNRMFRARVLQLEGNCMRESNSKLFLYYEKD